MKTTICFCIATILANAAFAHPGGLDSNGGHTDHRTGTYHYHGGGGGGGGSGYVPTEADLAAVTNAPRMPRVNSNKKPREKARTAAPVMRSSARPSAEDDSRRTTKDVCDVEIRARVAETRVRLAEQLSSMGNSSAATRWAQEVLDEFDDTDSAKRAAAILKKSRVDPRQGQFEGRVISVIDGDTVLVLDAAQREHRVQLASIDAPELCQDFGGTAKEALEQIVKGKPVAIEWTTRDRYERVIGVVQFERRSVNLQMVEDGWAWQDPEYDQSKEFADAERTAREKRLGLWAAKFSQPPWEFRKSRERMKSTP